jgi:hypothetical protein
MLQLVFTDVASCLPMFASMFFECWRTRVSNVANVLYGCCKHSLPMLQSFSTDVASIFFEFCSLQCSYVAIVIPHDWVLLVCFNHCQSMLHQRSSHVTDCLYGWCTWNNLVLQWLFWNVALVFHSCCMQYPVGETFMIDVAHVKSRCCSISLFMFQVLFSWSQCCIWGNERRETSWGPCECVKLVSTCVNAWNWWAPVWTREKRYRASGGLICAVIMWGAS